MTPLLNVDWRTVPNAPAAGTALCRMHELADGETREFVFPAQTAATPAFRMIVHRHQDKVHGYVNQCPHQWLPMNRYDGKFLMWSAHELMCAHHSAVFKLTEAGTCSMGPCQGSNLIAVPLAVLDDEVVIGTVE